MPDQPELRQAIAERMARAAGSKAFSKPGPAWDHARSAWLRQADTALTAIQPRTSCDSGHCGECTTCIRRANGDPWKIRYHQFGPTRLNPTLCTCGLALDAVIHHEPRHQFNTRPKRPHHIPVAGICTTCHHHETAACHTEEASQ